MSNIRDFTNKNTKFTGDDGVVLPSGTSAQRSSGTTGETRFNTDSGSLEYYDGANWVSTNLIPSINSISGNITQGSASNLTLSVTNSTDTIDVVYKEGGVDVATVTGQTVSSGSCTTAVPAAVYNQSAGDTITITIKNVDGTPSSNAITKTVVGQATGGSISNSGSYRIHTFTSSGTFTVPSGSTLTNVEYLVIAGGGGAKGGGGTPSFSNSNSFSFDGIDENFLGSSTYTELDGQNNYTFSFWIKQTSFNDMMIFSIGNGQKDKRFQQFFAYVDTSGRIVMHHSSVSFLRHMSNRGLYRSLQCLWRARPSSLLS